jgi:hypothetical protein
MSESKVRLTPTITTVVAVVSLVVAIGGWVNSCQEIDQQREALDQQQEALKLSVRRDSVKSISCSGRLPWPKRGYAR